MIIGPRSSIIGLIVFTFLIVAWFMLDSSAVHAHESRPLFIEIIETDPEVYTVKWKIPETVPSFNLPSPVMPASCVKKGKRPVGDSRGAYVREQDYSCKGGLQGLTLGVNYPYLNPSVSTLLRVETISGEIHNKLLGPDEKTWQVPEAENPYSIAKQYSLFGMSHILEGYDHLLFLACLIFIAGTGRKILITITGFTIAHSVTLVLSTLSLVTVPIPPVEAAIALSIVFLATEIAKEPRDTLTYKYPVAVSVFYVLNRLSYFPSVLKQIGLPQIELTTSLLFFNIGVEIGQVIFILLIIVLFKLLLAITKISKENVFKFEKPAAYIVGSLAALWMFQRIYSFLS